MSWTNNNLTKNLFIQKKNILKLNHSVNLYKKCPELLKYQELSWVFPKSKLSLTVWIIINYLKYPELSWHFQQFQNFFKYWLSSMYIIEMSTFKHTDAYKKRIFLYKK